MNPVAAGLVPQAVDDRWGSAHAHLAGEDDELSKVGPHLDLVPGWDQFLELSFNEELDLLHQHERTGRPMGDKGFVETLEQTLWRVCSHKSLVLRKNELVRRWPRNTLYEKDDLYKVPTTAGWTKCMLCDGEHWKTASTV